MKKLAFLLIPLSIFSQDVPIGEWKDYLSYNSAHYIAEKNDKIYCVTSNGLFYLQKSDNSIKRMSKITGLSEFDVKQIQHSSELDITIITYKNCNVDLIKNNQVINISDIKRKEITGVKSINNITLKNELAYLSCSFGLVLLDLEREEIKETYVIQKNGSILEVNDCAVSSNNQVFAATSLGLYVGEATSVLNDPNNWTLYSSEMNAVNVIRNDDIGCVLYKDNQDSYLEVFYPSSSPLFLDSGLQKITYNDEILLKIYTDSLLVTNNGIDPIASIKNEKTINVKHAITDSAKNIWVADSISGLLQFENYNYKESFIPEGPIRNDIYSLEFAENNLYLCHGGHSNFGLNSLINDGVSIKNLYDNWLNLDRWDLGNARDILNVAVKNGQQYYASWYHGIPFMQDSTLVERFGYENTGGILDTVYYSMNRIRVSDLKFDKNNNLWGLSSEVNNPLFVKTKNDEWFSFSMNQSVVGLYFDDLIVDSWGQKWGIIARGGGVFVYNDNNTIDDESDDSFKILTTNIGAGNLPSQYVYSIIEDREGAIWIGTNEGVGVFYNPSSVFSDFNFDAQQILIQENGYGQYLLSEEKVTCIKTDGANRKWIGTEKAGVFLLSSDGITQILHFTSENSPLFSNNIIDIAINQENGEVFIGTSKGLISYRSDATNGTDIASKAHVFPNPVRENYEGVIAVKGLTTNANVKITDIQGNLVFEDYAKGGQVTWNGKNKYNERAATGVYLVFSIDEDGKEKMVSKIMFIK